MNSDLEPISANSNGLLSTAAMAQSASALEEPYIYTPLPTPTSIRLLRRLGRNDNGLLNFALDTVDLRDGIGYHCLSYTWGNPYAKGVPFREAFEAVASDYRATNVTPICCNGKILKVRQNLYRALCEIPKSSYIHDIINRPDRETQRIRLHDKAEEGNAALVRYHIIQGAQVNSRDGLGRIPLHYAASNGHLEAAKMLIKAGSDIKANDNKQKTPKEYALHKNHQDMVGLLNKCFLDGGKAALDGVADFNELGPDAYIWIDAICIDQENLRERATQVGIMNSVYSNAAYVLAWLGPKDKYTMTALETVSKLSQAGENFANSNIVPYRTHSPAEYERAGVAYISQQEWDALASLFLRQWFRRIWVIQEVVFAKGILFYCGDTAIPWADVAYTMLLINRRYKALGYQSSTSYTPITDVALSVEYFFQALYVFRESRFELENTRDTSTEESFSLLRLIIDTFPFLATDPRDNVLALTALMTLLPRLKHRLVPDYSASVEHCYSRMTKIILDSTNDLEVLSLVQDRSLKRIYQLPSWVPDYSLQGTNPFPHNPFMACGSLGLSSNAHINFEDLNQLGLNGLEFDSITDAADARPLGGSNKKLELDASWFDLILKLDIDEDYRKTGQSLTEVLWRVLCVDQGLGGEHPAPLEFGEMFKTFICALICAEPEKQARQAERENENAIMLIGLMRSALKAQEEGTTESRGPDEEYMSTSRKRIATQHRTLDSSFFDSVRPTLSKLDCLAAKKAGTYIPTLQDIETYSQRSMEPISDASGNVGVPLEISPFLHAYNTCYGRRRLFITTKGYLGLGPASLEVGDAIWILPGAKVPFVLRAAAGESQDATMTPHYNLIGEAYIHGIMHGEAVEEDGSQNELREIILI